MNFFQTRLQIREYAKGKTWYWYVPFWLLGLYIFVQLLGFELDKQNAFIVAVPQAFDFMLHEMAHIMFAFAPALVTALAGSFSELLLGSLLVWGAFKGRTYFASLFCFLWLMLACMSVADYIADARAQQLPLVSLGGEMSGSTSVIHDWNFILSDLNTLSADTFLAGMVKSIGIIAGLFGLGFSAWVMYKIAAASDEDQLSQKEAELLHQSASAAGIHAAPPKHFQQLNKGELYPDATKGALAPKSEKVPGSTKNDD